MTRVVLDMNDRRPVWAMPDWVPDRLRSALPTGWVLDHLTEPTDGSGDGAGRVSDAVLDAVSEARIYLGYGIAEDVIRRGRSLEWVHSGAAGVGSSLTPAMKASDVVFTNSAGIHGPPMAETVLGMILHFGRGLDFAVRNKAAGRWSTDPYYVAGAPLRELSRMVVGVIGYGGVGREVARRVASLGARVVGLKRSSVRPEDAALTPVGGTGSLEASISVRSWTEEPGALDEILVGSDVVVLCAPDTPDTRGLIGADALARLKDGALLVNVARGRILDEAALVAELERGRIRGAGLDVFATEPLPDGHPFWDLPNVLPTPHVSAVTAAFWERQTELILHDLACFLRGDDPFAPGSPWRNVVDKHAGY